MIRALVRSVIGSLLDGIRITSANNSSILSKNPRDNTPRDYQVALASRNAEDCASHHARQRSLLAEIERRAASALGRARSASAAMFASREMDATLAQNFTFAN
jgi:hypothetical protein